MQVKDIMSTPAVTVDPDATLHDAIDVMLRNRVGSAVVVDEGVAGIVTRSDVLRIAYRAGGDLAEIPVSRGMTTDVVTTRPPVTIRKALSVMNAHNIKKLPVVEEFELVGVVTVTDIAHHLPERAREFKSSTERRDDWTD
jgi:CBS domain-containing protein